ncbi:MAG TPA: SDR family oxidoreductase, partial [Ilumatobacteraceae bacterium]
CGCCRSAAVAAGTGDVIGTVLITGCSSGFGLLTAVAFARRGDDVVATMRDTGKAGALLDAAGAAGVTVEVAPLDVCDQASIDATVDRVEAEHGGIDVLVNNAGVETFGAIHLSTGDDVLRQLDTNVAGIVRMVRAVAPGMIARRAGAIINVGSVAGSVGMPYGGLYAASKHAVEGLTEAMHFELAVHGIRVSVIQPGQFATDLGAKSIIVAGMDEDTPEYVRWQAFRTAMRKLVQGEPRDPQLVADVIVEAATTDTPRLRWRAGDDAELVLSTKASMDFEAFEATMRAALDWQD